MDIKTGLGLLVPVARNVLGLDRASDTLGAFNEQLGDMDLTIMFTDIDDFTSMVDRRGDERAQHLVRVHNEIVRNALSEHGGIEVKHTGDGIMACFLSSGRALAAATEVQERVAAFGADDPEARFTVAMGINAGQPIHEEGDMYGTAVIVAARVADLAEGGQVLATDVVRQLCAGKGFRFDHYGDVPVQGISEPVRVHEMDWRNRSARPARAVPSIDVGA